MTVKTDVKLSDEFYDQLDLIDWGGLDEETKQLILDLEGKYELLQD